MELAARDPLVKALVEHRQAELNRLLASWQEFTRSVFGQFGMKDPGFEIRERAEFSKAKKKKK
jgi:hypothetical protein